MKVGAILFRDRRGAAAAEMALVVPLLTALMLGAAELGRYFWSEHVLLKAVRDGTVYVSRQRIDNFDCASNAVNATVVNSTKALVRTGRMSGGADQLPNWTAQGAVFAVDLACVTSAGGTALDGIYTSNAGLIPVVTVRASVPYSSMFGLRSGLNLTARQQAAVYGA